MRITFCSLLVILILFHNCCTASYFDENLIEEPCQKICRCKHKENSSKIQVAHCIIKPTDSILECNVEWPVLHMTIQKVRFNHVLLSSCQRIKRVMITADSALLVLMPEMFKSSEQLEILVVQAPIQTINSHFMRHLLSLKVLAISETRVEHLSKAMFYDCLNVEEIRLSSNQIYSLTNRTFENCVQLKKLDLSHNRLKTINSNTFDKADNLETLDLSKNQIAKIEDFSFKNLVKLKDLNLNRNNLKSINRDTFSNIAHLSKLDLDSNPIEFIDDEAFNTLKNIKFIKLNENFLQRLDMVLFVNLNQLSISLTNVKCVIERRADYLLVSAEVQKTFEKFPLCSGRRNHSERRKPPLPNGQKIIQNLATKQPEPTIPKKGDDPSLISKIFEYNPYLFPMIFGGLAVLLISVIAIAIVCHVKNKQINDLKMQEIHLPMMQSTL